MYKYGKFSNSGMMMEWHEGDYLKMDKQFVQIWKRGDPERMVAAIHLDKGYTVRELSDVEAKRLSPR